MGARWRRWRLASVAVFTLLAVGCGGGGSDSAADAGTAGGLSADACLVRLHGKGGDGGSPDLRSDGVLVLAPTGTGEGWGGREWRYETADDLAAGTDVVRSIIDEAGCDRIVMHGFSNGASFAAASWCSGETFGDRLVGVVVDDPVPDAATAGCVPGAATNAVLYWTGALAEDAPPGTNCADIDWTCAGPITRPIADYAADLGVEVTASPNTDHEWNFDAPEIEAWLAG